MSILNLIKQLHNSITELQRLGPKSEQQRSNNYLCAPLDSALISEFKSGTAGIVLRHRFA